MGAVSRGRTSRKGMVARYPAHANVTQLSRGDPANEVRSMRLCSTEYRNNSNTSAVVPGNPCVQAVQSAGPMAEAPALRNCIHLCSVAQRTRNQQQAPRLHLQDERYRISVRSGSADSRIKNP